MLEFIGKKIGMTHIYSEAGQSTPLTMIHLYSNTVFDLKENQKNSNDKLLTIAFNKLEKTKNISKSVVGAYQKKSLPVHKLLHTCKVKDAFEIEVGKPVLIENFIKQGDKVSIRGVTTGKGFAGVMKRWNFRGLEASHGVSVSHRSHGSTGQRQDPGKTFRGKKMAGHLGVENITIKNLQVLFVDIEASIIAVKGAIPGRAGNDILVKISNY
ncbi:MAG: 50S ribosomal protein L3 [Proteobacteria bacterium]|jgi:large subunit ribosomal protein L3|nr:50S ribosomal protein L3 [Pseudomonadota bacterium]